MAGLGFILLSFMLIIAEAHVPSFGVLGIAGIIALLYGGHLIIEAGGIFGIPVDWGFFLGLAVCFIVPMVWASLLAVKAFKRQTITGLEGMIGREAIIADWSGHAGRVMIQGELWQAFSEHLHDFKEGDTVIVSGTEELKLRIRIKN